MRMRVVLGSDLRGVLGDLVGSMGKRAADV